MKEKKKWNELSKKSQKALSITAFLIFILFSLFLFIMVGVPMVKHAKDPEAFRTWIDSMGIWGRIAFIGMNILQVLVAVIPGGPLEVAGGYAFGHFEAMILCTIGMGIGSALVFLLVRYFGYKLVEAFFPVEKINELKFLKSTKSRDILILLLFLIPGTPKDLVAYFCGLTEIKFSTFILIATFARIPGIWGSTAGGSAMGDKSYVAALIIMAIVFACTVIGVLISSLIVKRNGKKKDNSASEESTTHGAEPRSL